MIVKRLRVEIDRSVLVCSGVSRLVVGSTKSCDVVRFDARRTRDGVVVVGILPIAGHICDLESVDCCGLLADKSLEI